MSTRERRIAAAVVALVAGVGMAVASGADAQADPPSPSVHNGQISIGRYDPALGTTSLWVADADGRHEQRLILGPTGFSDWAPDGREIAFDFTDDVGDVHLGLVHPDGTGRRTLTRTAGVQEAPSWSPDGAHIAFDAFDAAQPVFSTSIWVIRSDGSGARQVTSDGFDVEPTFSPQGPKIAFARIVDDVNGTAAVYVVARAGGAPRLVVPPTRGLEHPDWSPDGRWIAFDIGPEDRGRPHAGAVFVVHPDGTDLHVLRAATSHRVFFKPRWSPDGRRLISGCFDDRVGRDQLCTFAAHRKARIHTVRLRMDQPVNLPAWGPRPTREQHSEGR